MASAWGLAWGKAWGNAWGAVEVITAPFPSFVAISETQAFELSVNPKPLMLGIIGQAKPSLGNINLSPKPALGNIGLSSKKPDLKILVKSDLKP